jgi:hypothetical protein
MNPRADGKLELVNQISQLTDSGPEKLGPGSKERKSVLVNLAMGLGISFNHSMSKQEIGTKIVTDLGGYWLPEFESTGQTITKRGLIELLHLAEAELQNRPQNRLISTRETFQRELSQIAQISAKCFPRIMDGKTCVIEMKAVDNRNWKQVQWQGFYFEMRAVESLTRQLGGGKRTLYNTEFDYVRNFIWDIKAHSTKNESGSPSSSCMLNDVRAMEAAISDTGLGFVVLSGDPTYDREFTRWHKKFRGGGDDNPGRTLKSKFEGKSLDVFFIKDMDQLNEAKSKKAISEIAQGKNSNGKPRPSKYQLDFKRAVGSELQVYSIPLI